MSDDSDKFENKPFTLLDPARFPKDCIENPPSKKIIDKKDQALFLNAMKHFRLPVTKVASAFTLAEQCTLPAISKMKKKSKKLAPAAPPILPDLEKETSGNEFLDAMRAVQPLGGQGRRIAQKPLLRPMAQIRDDTMEDFMEGKLEFSIFSSGEYLEGHVAGLDEMILNRLRSGQFSPEAHLDLHGLNSEQAFESLKEFMRQAWLKDLRTVLIVTGRGHNSPDGHGILRQKLQMWLTREPFKRIVLGFCTARAHDGGPGSIYALLRRFRKKGRILWERSYFNSD